jgi:hypothetical protein
MDLTRAENIFAKTGSPDVVTAIGGLCTEVVWRNDALRIATQVFNSLKPGGLFIVTGASYSLLNSDDFRKIGFIVEQMSIPQNIVANQKPPQMYVLRKPY